MTQYDVAFNFMTRVVLPEGEPLNNNACYAEWRGSGEASLRVTWKFPAPTGASNDSKSTEPCLMGVKIDLDTSCIISRPENELINVFWSCSNTPQEGNGLRTKTHEMTLE